MSIPLGSICSGYGGLESGIALAIPDISVRWVADYEPPTPKKPKPTQGAARILAHRYPGIPNLGDITKVAWPTTRPVRIVCGGTPCQDVSHAGARRGLRAGTRSGIWSSMVEAIAHHRPTLVVWENVRGALSAEADSNVEPCPICMGDERECSLRALGRVLGDLAELGYDACWRVVSAASVGAPHRRDRVFVVAWPAADTESNGQDERRTEPAGQLGRPHVAVDGARTAADADVIGSVRGRPARRRGNGPADDGNHAADPGSTGLERAWTCGDEPEFTEPVSSGRPVADPDSVGREPVESGVCPGEPDPSGCGRAVAADADIDPVRGQPVAVAGGSDPAEHRHPVQWGEFAGAVDRWERVLGRPAPAPTEAGPKGGQRLSPAFVEWMMGLPAGHVTDVPGLTRNDQLHALGNGVVPLQAGAAVGFLLGFAPAWVRAELGLSTRFPTTVDGVR